MNSLFSLDSKIVQFFSRVAELMLLNLLWLVTCLPIITIGAANTAMYKATFSLIRDEGSSVFTIYFRSFITNFRQSTAIFFIMLLLTVLLVADAWVIFAGLLPYASFQYALLLVPGVVILFMGCYVHPLIAMFENTTRQMLKNAFLLSFANLPVTITVAVLNLLPLLILYFHTAAFLAAGVIWVMLGFSTIAYVNSIFLNRIFNQLMETDPSSEDMSID